MYVYIKSALKLHYVKVKKPAKFDQLEVQKKVVSEMYKSFIFLRMYLYVPIYINIK